MKKIGDLGKLVKTKYPEYGHLSDEEVGRRVKAKYPTAYQDFQDTSLQPLTPDSSFDKSLTELTGGIKDLAVDPRLEENLQVLLDYYNPKRGRVTAWWQRHKSGGRTHLLNQVSEEYLAVLQQARFLEEETREGRKKEIDFRMFVANNALLLTQIKAQNFLVMQAQEDGLTLEASQSVRLDRELSKTRVNEAWEMSNVKVSEHDRLTRIELDRKIEEAENTVRLAILDEFMSEHQKIMLLQDLLDVNYKQIAKIERDLELSENVRRLMLEDRYSNIETFKKDMNARKERLLQTHNRQDS